MACDLVCQSILLFGHLQVTTGATHSLALEPLQHLIQAMQNDQQKFRQAVDFVNKSLVRSSVDGPPKQKKQRVQLLQHKPLLLFVVPTESLYLWKKVQTYTINKKKVCTWALSSAVTSAEV